jgi:mercuric ion binding protein
VENMSCGTCPIVVKKALERVPGVSSTTVDFDKKMATVTFDPDKASSAKLIQATTDAGFPSKVIGKP